MRTRGNAEADRQCLRLAEGQLGLVDNRQLLDLGLNRQAILRRRDSGFLVPVISGVYRIAGTPLTWLLFSRATHMWLRGRGVLSHRTSATLQKLIEESTRPIEVPTVRCLRAPHEDIRIHRVNQLESRDLRWFDGMRITNAVRTVIDLAGALPLRRFDHVVDEGRRRRLIAERPLRKALDRLGRNGRSGAGLIAKVLDDGEFRLPVPGSPFERNFLHFLEAHSLPTPKRQHRIMHPDGREVARVDFAYPDLMIAIECDGRKHHFGTNDWEHDVARRSKLAALGWRVIHISWEMLTTRPLELLDLLRELLGVRALF